MILPASYSNGFAPRDGQPLYPELWRGCVGAWNPCLGPTGLTLRDWSGYGNHSTDVSVSQWGVSEGKYRTGFTGSESYTIPHAAQLLPSTALSVMVFARVNNLTGNPFLIDKNFSTSFYMQLYGTNQIEFGAVFSAGGYVNSGTNAYSLNTPQCFIGTFNSVQDTIRVYINGIQTVVSTSATAAMPSGTGTIRVGRQQSAVQSFLNGSIYEIRIYSRELSQQEAALLSLRPGISQELAPRRRSSVQVAGFNRRRRLLIGASS